MAIFKCLKCGNVLDVKIGESIDFCPYCGAETISSNQNKIESNSIENSNINIAQSTEPLLKRAALFLEDSMWQSAYDYYEKVLDLDPENSRAYIGELLAELSLKQESLLQNIGIPLTNYAKFEKALRFADEDYKKILIKYNKANLNIIEELQKEKIYQKALLKKQFASNKADFLESAEIFSAARGYKDCDLLAEECKYLAENREIKKKKNIKNFFIISSCILVVLILSLFVIRPNLNYNKATDLMKNGNYLQAGKTFFNTKWYKDSSDKGLECALYYKNNKQYAEAVEILKSIMFKNDKLDTALSDCTYLYANALIDQGNYSKARDQLMYIQSYKDGKLAYNYCYAMMNIDNRFTALSYLKDLSDANYRNSAALYADLSAWKITMVGNSSASDTTTNLTSISKYSPLYIHVVVSGGNNSDTLYLKYGIIYPSGNTIIKSYTGGLVNKSTVYSYWSSGVNGYSGTLTINYYNQNTDEFLGSYSIEITN